MQHGDVVFDDGGLSDDDARAMIDQNPVADAGRGMDIDGKDLRDTVLQEQGQRFALLLPEPVGDAVRLQGLKPFEVQKGLRIGFGRRIAFLDGPQVGPDRLGDLWGRGEASSITSRTSISARLGPPSFPAR